MNLDWFGDSISFSSKLTDSNAFQRLGWKKTQNQNLEKNCSTIPNTKNFLQKRSSDNTVQIELKKKSKLSYDSDGFTSSDNEKSTNNNSPASQLLQPENVDFFMLDQEDKELKQKIVNHLDNFGAKLEDSQIFNDQQQLKIRCFLNHIFSLSFSQIQQKQWCKKCEINLEKVQQMAEQKNGKILNELYQSELIIQCKNNHQFSLNHKNWNRKWCQQCNQQQKSYIKQFYQMEEKRIQDSNLLFQEKLFEEARLTMQQKIQNKITQNEQEIASIQKKAKILSNNQSQNQTQLEEMFKVHLMSESILSNYLKSQTDIKQEYKKLSLNIHPDKNRHPLAVETFKKLNNVYQNL